MYNLINVIVWYLKKNKLVKFWIMNKIIFRYIKNDKTYLERSPLEKIASKGQLTAFKHDGFWQCMDTLRDKEILEKKIKDKDYFEKK